MTAALRLRVLPRFPARITGQDGVKVTRAGNSPDLTVSLDFANLGDIAGIPDPANNYFAMYDETTESYVRIPFQSMFDAAGVSSGYPTKAAAELAVIPAPVSAILLFGDATVGDGLGGLYIDVNNGSSDTFVSAGGTSRTWYRAKDVSTARLTDEVTAKLPPLAPNTMPVDNAGGTARETKTFPQVRNLLDVPVYVETRAALKALDTTNDTLAYLKESGREGVFKWTAGDYSTQIAADTQEGVYVKADAIAATVGAWVRVVASDVSAFGASATSDSSVAITAMATLLGYVRFPAGNTLVDADLTIDAPVYFANGAFVTVAGTRTLTITEVIDSPKQHIFRGAGSVVLGNDSNSGENSRQVHVSWFGAFPGKSVDQAPEIQKALNAVGNSRESIIDFDVGNYLISSAMTTTRGAWIRGSGTRRTVFLTTADGFDVFATSATACRFTDIQFENKAPLSLRTSGAWIRISHDFCEVANVFHHPADNGIIIDNGGTNAKVNNVEGVYSVAPSSGSRMVLVRASGARVKGVYCRFSTNGPTSIVEVGTGASGSIITPLVDDVEWVGPSIGVLIHGDSVTVARGRITNINYRGSSGNAPQAIKFLTSGTGSVFGFSVDGVEIAAVGTAGITFQQNSSGEMKEITLSDVWDAGVTGNGIELIRTAGTLGSITISDTVDCRRRATPIFQSGTMSNIRISPNADPNGDNAKCFFNSQVADDTAIVIDLHKLAFSGILMVTLGTANYGLFAIRAAGTPAMQPITVSANVNSTTGALTGTTGTDAKATVSVSSDGKVYVENRLGSAQNVSVTVLAGPAT